MTWALISGGNGFYRDMLDLSGATFHDYAIRHRIAYALMDITCSWDKVDALIQTLQRYEGAIWIDADAVIVDSRHDIREELGDKPFGWVIHDVSEGKIPNFGVVVMTRNAVPFLQDMLTLKDKYEHHGWWEQAAAMELMGYTSEVRTPPFEAAQLPLAWNVLFDRTPCEHPYIVHASGALPPAFRLRAMREALARL
jgi:hypothetical protein